MLLEKISKSWFKFVHRKNLVYNACWEDPRLDRIALDLGPDDNLVVITSAGCNALDYALDGPKHVYAVDINPLQNALLDLKLAGIRTLDYSDFFDFFGRGYSERCLEIYRDALRPDLPEYAAAIWDRRIEYFSGNAKRKSFYFRGSSGTFAWFVNFYINRVAKVRSKVEAILAAETVEEQRRIFFEEGLKQSFWKPFIRWAVRRDATLAMLGVPRGQRQQLDRDYPGGITRFIEDRIETVFAKLPLKDNYFWRVYLTGHYTPECCPEYLTQEGFGKLKGGLVNHVSTQTDSLLGFLDGHPGTISRFILLDHMDWLYSTLPDVLAAEWQAMFDRAAPGSKFLYRSAGLEVDFVNPIPIRVNGQNGTTVGDHLAYQNELAAELHVKDRVHTYGSFYIADLLPH